MVVEICLLRAEGRRVDVVHNMAIPALDGLPGWGA